MTRKEVLLWTDKNHDATLTQIGDLPDGIYSVLAQIDFQGQKSTINVAHNYTKIIAHLPLTHSYERVQPLYAKDPNITLKNISHAY